MSCSEWKEVRLGEVCKIRRGSSPRPIKDYLSNSGMPWVKIADATEGNSRYIEKTNEFIKLEGVQKSVVVNPGSLILSNSGTAALPMFMGIKACIHDGWQVFEDFIGIDRYYLYYVLLFIRERLLHGANDSTMKNLTLDMVRDAIIELPSIQEQTAIAETLSCLDDKIELNNQINKNLEEMAQAIFKSWFVDFEPFQNGEFEESELGLIPKGWRVEKSGDIFDISIGKTPPRKEPEWFSNNSKDESWVSISDMGKSGLFIYNTSEYLTKDAINKHNVKEVPPYTVLLSFKLTVGRVAITSKKMYTNEAIAHFKSYNDNIIEFLYFYLKTFNYDSLGNTSSIATAINSKVIKDMPIIIPTDTTLSDYHNLVVPLFNQIKKNEEELLCLKNIRDTLLPKLMSGEIRVPIEEV